MDCTVAEKVKYLATQLQYKPQHTMGSWVLRPEVHGEILQLLLGNMFYKH